MSTVPADVLAPLDAKTSAATMMTDFDPCMHRGPIFLLLLEFLHQHSNLPLTDPLLHDSLQPFR